MLRRIILGGAGLALVPLLAILLRVSVQSQPPADLSSASSTPAPVSAAEERSSAPRTAKSPSVSQESITVRVTGGTLQLDFDNVGQSEPALRFAANGAIASDSEKGTFTFPVLSEGAWRLTRHGDDLQPIVGQTLSHGGLLLLRDGRREVLGNLGLGIDRQGRLTVMSTLDESKFDLRAFELNGVTTQLNEANKILTISGRMRIADDWAARLGEPAYAGCPAGSMRLILDVERVNEAPAFTLGGSCGGTDTEGRPLAGSVGPDIIVADLQTVQYYGNVGDIHAYAVGTHACNLGDERANWIAQTNQHPVIVQNMYRLRDNEFEEIGMSWVKHGFYAVSWSLCGPCNDPTDGTQLGIGCSDPYSANMNGVQSNMSPRSGVSAFTGQFTYPWSGWQTQPPQSLVDRRIQVHAADLNPSLNPGARYFVQGHYIAADDAAAGNQFNNASYREVLVLENAGKYFVSPTGQTQRQQPAVRAWQDVDPTVVETDVEVPNEGLFILAAKSVLIAPGQWRYIYALQNLNSDRAARRFAVPLPDYAVVSNMTFHDAVFHSGEPYDTTDWTSNVGSSEVEWFTDTAAANINANALRWGNVNSFTFECNAPPAPATATIGLFLSGTPMELSAETLGPLSYFVDCNTNTIEDRCEVSCANPGCSAPCGGADDCDGNFVPDDCETDCDGNGVNDVCDLRDGTHADCNNNRVPDICDIALGTSTDNPPDGIPDECQQDCNENGIPDDIDIANDPSIDCDVNGVPDICELIGRDCNLNLRLDECDLALGSSQDCNGTEIPDECELSGNDCNGNSVPDECDPDCDGNAIPDDCEPFLDCNGNTIRDACDVAVGTSDDCDLNWVPDECQPDCDNNGIIDPCDNNPDTDGDGVWDCYDLCPATTPADTCLCPDRQRCCFPNLGDVCLNDIPVDDCLAAQGIPQCVPQPCRDGCLIGDADGDGDRDLADVAGFQNCYTGESDWVGFAPAAGECARIFDEGSDGAIDLVDFETVEEYLTGPQ
ncbi:MAG: hypothetical protein J5J06_04915 [Phycisphaerae bacterium]|nr:hypothetical protein [Phycisphaerae bacterium]